MDTQHFKIKLEEEKNILESELSRLGIQDPETGEWAVRMDEAPSEETSDPNNRGDRDEEFGVAENTLQILEVQYKNVLHALEKIEQGTYGTCEVSGEMIEEDRLEAEPAARTCISHIN